MIFTGWKFYFLTKFLTHILCIKWKKIQCSLYILLALTFYIRSFFKILDQFWILLYFLYSKFLLVIYFVHISVYMSIPISHFIPPPPPSPTHFSPMVFICLFSTSVSLFLLCKPVHLYHFSRFHIYVLIYDICFSLSDLVHSVWQSLGPSTSLQMTQFHSF